MKHIGYYLTYYPVFLWMYLHARLPFCILYLLADIFYFIAYKVVRYRVNVVRENLKNAFPDKTLLELRTLEKRFYHHFADYFVETIKLLHFPDNEVDKRMIFKNMELVEDLVKDGNSCLMFLGHYGNWEWVPSITRCFQTEGYSDVLLGQIYRKLKNKAFDDIFLKLRSRFGSISIEKDNTFRDILQLKKAKNRVVIGFMSDQTPSPRNIYYWTNFMNQETPFFIGVERIAKKTGFSVTYLDVKKVRRGYYECSVKVLAADPATEPEFSITEKYAREMEKTILRDPAYWLWTHKRWKYKKEMFEPNLTNEQE